MSGIATTCWSRNTARYNAPINCTPDQPLYGNGWGLGGVLTMNSAPGVRENDLVRIL